MTVLYLLVEESFRELASRQIIAADCLSKGLQVVIAQQWWFSDRMADLPPGIVLFKGNNRTQGTLMQAAKNHGHLITSIEEEAFGVTFEAELATMFSPNAMDVVDMVFAQGTKHRDFLAKRFAAINDRVVVTGNPRTDVISLSGGAAFKEKAENLRREIGDFVLVNTNSGAINPYDIDTYSHFMRCKSVGVLSSSDPADMSRFESLLAWEHLNLREICRFLRIFAKQHPQVPVILRPHPAENAGRWEKACGPLSNVTVVNDTNHIAWMLAARVMLHTGCTTGLEGALLGTPVIGICPGENDWHDGFISNLVSHVYRTGAEVSDVVGDHLSPGKPDLARLSSEALERLQPSLYVESSQRSSARIAEVFGELATRLVAARSTSDLDHLAVTRSWLDGRRYDKAFVSLDDFQRLWASVEKSLNFRQAVSVKELAPAVFFMKIA
jgi:surface carbohydrate biosynthesis protein